jgi:hypothetical protein
MSDATVPQTEAKKKDKYLLLKLFGGAFATLGFIGLFNGSSTSQTLDQPETNIVQPTSQFESTLSPFPTEQILGTTDDEDKEKEPTPTNTIVPMKGPTSKPTPVSTKVEKVENTQPSDEIRQFEPSRNSGGGDKDCADFSTHEEAQAYFESKGGSATNNVDRLDGDHDGLACEK